MLTGRSYGGMPAMSCAVDEDAARGRRLEARQHAQQRRLAAARAAEQAEDLAAVDVQRDVVDRDEVAELLGDVLDADVGLRACGSFQRLLLWPVDLRCGHADGCGRCACVLIGRS